MFLNLFATTTLALSLGRALAAVQFKGVNIAGYVAAAVEHDSNADHFQV